MVFMVLEKTKKEKKKKKEGEMEKNAKTLIHAISRAPVFMSGAGTSRPRKHNNYKTFQHLFSCFGNASKCVEKKGNEKKKRQIR